MEAPERVVRYRPLLADVTGVAAHALVAAGAERVRPLAGEDDHADLAVLARRVNAREISITVCGRKALRTSGRSIVIFAMPPGVVGALVADVGVLAGGGPGGGHGGRLAAGRPAQR